MTSLTETSAIHEYRRQRRSWTHFPRLLTVVSAPFPLWDPDGVLLGIITDGDVRRTLQRHGPSDLTELRTEDVMTRDPIVVEPDLMAYEALRLMEDRPSQIAVLPVVEDGRSVGLIRLHDLVRMGL